MLRFLILLNLFLSTFTILRAQTTYKIFNEDIALRYEKVMREKFSENAEISYSIRPFYLDNLIVNFDSLLSNEYHVKSRKQNSFARGLLYGNLLDFKSDKNDIQLYVNPVYNLQLGRGTKQTLYSTSLGVRLDLNISKKLFVSTSLVEENGIYPAYISRYIDSLNVVPGSGAARRSSTKSVNNTYTTGFIGFRPSKYLYVEAGFDKNFFGSGTRSLLLSDVGYNYPYIKLYTNLGPIKYSNIWAQLTDTSLGIGNKTPKKYAVFNYLTYTGIKRLQLSFFQSIVWANRDSMGRRTGQDWGYFIPILYLNALNFNNGSPDNNLIGLDVNYQIGKSYVLYGQVIIDDMDFSQRKKVKGHIIQKQGMQIGMKVFKLFGVKDLFGRFEYNVVRPYTYGHRNATPVLNYVHYGEVLAHPLGANFKELVIDFSYQYKKFFLKNSFLWSKYGADTSNSHWGQNPFKNDYLAVRGPFSVHNFVGQGVSTTLWLNKTELKFLLNPVTNSSLSLSFLYRKEKSITRNFNEKMFYVTFATGLTNPSWRF